MLPKAEMVPKECGFNQSETACGLCAEIARRFPCLHATAKDGELIKNAAFLPSHRYNSPSKLKLGNNQTVLNVYIYGCNNNTLFSEITIFTFPTVGVALMIHATWKDGSTVEFIIFRVQAFLSP